MKSCITTILPCQNKHENRDYARARFMWYNASKMLSVSWTQHSFLDFAFRCKTHCNHSFRALVNLRPVILSYQSMRLTINGTSLVSFSSLSVLYQIINVASHLTVASNLYEEMGVTLKAGSATCYGRLMSVSLSGMICTSVDATICAIVR